LRQPLEEGVIYICGNTIHLPVFPN
jgi:hypothetical protein